VTLVGGEPGIGKSTLLLQVVARQAADGARCLIVSAEESAQQVRLRAERLGAAVPGVWLVAATDMPAIRAAIADIEPDVVVVDSVQTVWDPELEAGAGSVTQVRGCAQELVALAKQEQRSVLLVGHVTKEGSLAGPRVLEHVVDTVVSFEGDRHHALRILRATKHRFGATGELGVFEMTGAGLTSVADPSGLFLGDRTGGTAGSVVFPAMEGQRPLLVELQALVTPSAPPAPRRSVSGLDAQRLALLLAVLDRRAGIGLRQDDVYVSVVGGVRVGEPGADLAVCLALASAGLGRPVPDDLVVLGEVGLGGELRQVAQTPRRLNEAARLGFAAAIVPLSGPDHGPLPLRRAANLLDALHLAFPETSARRHPDGVGVREPAGDPSACAREGATLLEP
jgi:DNA repair protein RadA/Sms